MNLLLLPQKRQRVARKTSRSSSQDFKAALISTYVPEYNIKWENIRGIFHSVMALIRHTEISWSSWSFQILGALR